MELQPGGADAVLGSGAQGAHARAPRPAPPPRHGSSAWRPSSRRPMERRGPWLAQAAEPRADPARGRRKRTARARPPPPPPLQRAGSTAHTPATAAPRSRRGFSGPGRRRCYPDGGLRLLHRARASPPRAGRYAARGPRRRALARPALHCRAGAAPAVPHAGAASAAGGREAGELDALPRRSVRAATGGRPRAASHGRREQGPYPPDPLRSSSAPWPRATATSSSWRRKAGVGGVRPPPPPQSRRGRPRSAVAAPPARVGLRARAAQATGRGSRGGGGVAPRRREK